MAFARLYVSKFSWGSMTPPPLTTLAATPLVGQMNARLPPPPKKKYKILDPYAYDLAWYDKLWQGRFTKHPPTSKKIVW